MKKRTLILLIIAIVVIILIAAVAFNIIRNSQESPKISISSASEGWT